MYRIFDKPGLKADLKKRLSLYTSQVTGTHSGFGSLKEY